MSKQTKLVTFTDKHIAFMTDVKNRTLISVNAQIRALVDQEIERVKKLENSG